MKKPILCSVDIDTGIWTDDEGREWVPAPRALPTDGGAVITWEDGAYLPQIAQLDGGHMQLLWRLYTDDGGRWLKESELLDRIGPHIWTRLVPERLNREETERA